MHVRSDSGAALTLLGRKWHDRDRIQVIWRGERCRLQDFHLAKARSLHHTSIRKTCKHTKCRKIPKTDFWAKKNDFWHNFYRRGVVLILKKSVSLGSQVKNEWVGKKESLQSEPGQLMIAKIAIFTMFFFLIFFVNFVFTFFRPWSSNLGILGCKFGFYMKFPP